MRNQTVYEYDAAGNNIATYIYYYNDWSNELQLELKYEYTFELVNTLPSDWTQDGFAWYYYEDGKAVTGWQQIDGTWYYLNESGAWVE